MKMKNTKLNSFPLSIAITGTEESIVKRFQNILKERIESISFRSVLGVVNRTQFSTLLNSNPLPQGIGQIETVIALVDRSSAQAGWWFKEFDIQDPLRETINKLQIKKPDFENKRLPLRNEAIAITVRKINNQNFILVCLSDQKAAGLGCGWLLNCLRFENNSFYYEPLNNEETQIIVPKQPTRGHMLATHLWSSNFDCMTEAMWEKYAQDMALMGVNLLMNVPMHPEEWPRMHFADGKFKFDDNIMQEKFEQFWNVHMKHPKMWKDLGMDFGIWIPPNDVLVHDSIWENHLDGGKWCDNACPNNPKERKMILELREHLFANLSHLDLLIIPSGDTGGCHCSKCTPWPKTYIKLAVETADIAKKYFPDVKLGISNQLLPESQKPETWYDEVIKNESKIDYICYAPGGDPVETLHQKTKHLFPLLCYMDITHSQLDANYLKTFKLEDKKFNWRITRTYQTAHLEIIPYSQSEFIERLHHLCENLEATAPYSEGIHDDVNKFIWTLLDIDPALSVEQIMSMYSRRYMASDNRWTKLKNELEYNFDQDPFTNHSSTETLNLASRINDNAIDSMRYDFRWPMFLMRAYLDHYMIMYYQSGKMITDILSEYAKSQHFAHICQILLTIYAQPPRWPRIVDLYGGTYNDYPNVKRSINPKNTQLKTNWPSLEKRNIFLKEENYPLPAGFLKTFDKLFRNILQSYKCRDKVHILSDFLLNNYAMELEAAARIRDCITSLDWAKDYLFELAYNKLDEKRKQRIIEHILNPQLKTSESFYDDCGRKFLPDKPWDPKRPSDNLCTHLSEFTEETIFATDLDLINRDSQEVRAFGTPNIKMNYTGLDTNKIYGLRITYLQNIDSTRFQSLWAGSHQIHESIFLPQKTAREFEYILPKDSYANGNLNLLFKYEGGYPENSVVSEVWVYPI
jgi:hypothetical protein